MSQSGANNIKPCLWRDEADGGTALLLSPKKKRSAETQAAGGREPRKDSSGQSGRQSAEEYFKTSRKTACPPKREKQNAKIRR